MSNDYRIIVPHAAIHCHILGGKSMYKTTLMLAWTIAGYVSLFPLLQNYYAEWPFANILGPHLQHHGTS
jgi:hypothetical protein